MRILTGIINLNKKDDWETPPHIFQEACDYFAVSPLLDVCATEKNSLCKYHYSENSLDKPYNLDFFCNPPYSEVKHWIRKCYLEHVKHNVSGLMLIFAKTDVIAWHEYIFGKAEILFLKGRLHFFQEGKESKHPAPYPSAIICFRKKL